LTLSPPIVRFSMRFRYQVTLSFEPPNRPKPEPASVTFEVEPKMKARFG
jgi:hypothetical protein